MRDPFPVICVKGVEVVLGTMFFLYRGQKKKKKEKKKEILGRYNTLDHNYNYFRDLLLSIIFV